jgi:hypothetical protein
MPGSSTGRAVDCYSTRWGFESSPGSRGATLRAETRRVASRENLRMVAQQAARVAGGHEVAGSNPAHPTCQQHQHGALVER